MEHSKTRRAPAIDKTELRQALALYQGFKRSNDVMFWCDKDARIVDVNEAFVRHYGYARNEVIGKRPAILRSKHSTDAMYQKMWQNILDPDKGYWRGHVINVAKDGREIPLILTITAVRGAKDDIVGFMSNAVDISDQLALQSRLAQAEALASLGEMAAVVAHEIRNPLGSIVMAAEQLSSGTLEPADREMVQRVLRSEGQRLNRALTNFLNYARPRALRLERKSLNVLAEEVCGMLRSNKDLLGSIRLSLALDPALKPLLMDGDQLRQVLWNVMINAVQAMQGKGRLSVSTRLDRGMAALRVADTGPGIAPERLADLFKPFHTSKNEGTGLGLAVAERIIKAHGGRIEVDARPGKGAAFTILLPLPEE